MVDKEIRVLIADDHKPFRESLSAFLNEIPSITVVGEAKDGYEAQEMAIALNPNIVLSDIKMPRQTGIEAAQFIREHRPEIKIILFSMHENNEFMNANLKAADRFIPKQRLFEDIVGAIQEMDADRKEDESAGNSSNNRKAPT